MYLHDLLNWFLETGSSLLTAELPLIIDFSLELSGEFIPHRSGPSILTSHACVLNLRLFIKDG